MLNPAASGKRFPATAVTPPSQTTTVPGDQANLGGKTTLDPLEGFPSRPSSPQGPPRCDAWRLPVPESASGSWTGAEWSAAVMPAPPPITPSERSGLSRTGTSAASGPVRQPALPLRKQLERARAAVAGGSSDTAREILGRALKLRHTEGPDPDIADAATLYAHLLLTDAGDHVAAGPWAAYAHNATLYLHGRADERTIAAVLTHARVLGAGGDVDAADELWFSVLATAADETAVRTILTNVELAEMHHQNTLCPSGLDVMGELCDRRSDRHGRHDPLAITLLGRLGAMYRDCGHTIHAEACIQGAAILAASVGEDLAATVALLEKQHDPFHADLCAYELCPPQPIPEVPALAVHTSRR